MEETEDIRVTRPVYNQFHNILMETQLTSNSLMKHFFHLYNGSLTQISTNDPEEININNTGVTKGDKYSKVVVNIPRRLLKRDISVNVTVPDIDPCRTSDSDEDSEDESTSGPMSCRNTEMTVSMDTAEMKSSLNSERKEMKNHDFSLKELAGTTNQQQTYNCNLCIFKTKGLRKFKNHLRKHSEKQLNCAFCEKVFLDKSHLNFHVKTNHGKNDMDNGEINEIKTVREDILNDKKSHHGNGNNEENDISVWTNEPPQNLVQDTLDFTNQNTKRNCCENGLSEKKYDESEDEDKIKGLNHPETTKGDNNMQDNCQEIRGDNLPFTMQNEQINGYNNSTLQTNINLLEGGEEFFKKNEAGNFGSAAMKPKIFMCRLCGALFSNAHFYKQHKYRCMKDKLCVCKCKRKFQWRSQFLHHKAKCMVNSLFRQKGTLYRRKETRRNAQKLKKKITKNYCKKLPGRTREVQYMPGNDTDREICTSEVMSENQNTNEITSNEIDHGKSERSLMECSNANNTSSKKCMEAVDTETNFNISCPEEMLNLPSVSETGNFSFGDIGNEDVTSKNELSPMPNINYGCNGDNDKDLAFKTAEKYQNDLAAYQEKLNIASEHSFKEENISKQDNNQEPKMEIDLSCVKTEPVDSDNFMDIFTQKGRQSCEKLFDNIAHKGQFNSQHMRFQSDFHSYLPNYAQNSRFGNLSGDDGDSNVKCEECGEMFKRKAYLKEHMEGKHGGDLRYSCDCGKKFKWRSSLGSHRKNCYKALMSFLPPESHTEGQTEGQNVSVIDFSQCAIPYMNMQNEWIQEIEKMTQSVLSQNKDLSGRHGTRQRHLTSPEIEYQNGPLAQRRKSDSILRNDKIGEQSTSLRINTASVKPFADALSKYKQKPAVSSHGDTSSAVNNNVNTNRVVKNFGNRLSTGERNPSMNSFGDKNVDVNSGNHYDKNPAVNNFVERKSEDKIASPSKINTKNTVDLRFGKNETYSYPDSYSAMSSIKKTQDNNHNTSMIQMSSSHGGSQVIEKGRTAARAKSCDFVSTNLKRKTVLYPNTDDMECTFCKEKFTSKVELEKHKLFCKHLQDTCSVCGKTFKFRTELVNHLLSCHGNDETLSCFCGLTFSDWSMLENHCKNCPDFKTQSAFLNVSQKNLSTHERNVTLPAESLRQNQEVYSKPVSRTPSNQQFGTIQPKQNYCGTQTSRQVEKNILPNISSFVSPAEKSGVQNSTTALTHNKTLFQLDENVNQSGSTTAEEIGKNDVFVCTFCGNIYNSIEKFTEHNKIHHGGNLFPHDKNKQVTSAVDVAISKARHLTSKMPEHVCHLCGDVFAAKAYLKEHISGKHGTVDRYTCACGMKFKWRSSLGIHQKRCPKSTKRTYNRWNSS